MPPSWTGAASSSSTLAAHDEPADRPRPRGLRVVQWDNDRVDRAVAEDDSDGLTRLVLDVHGRILGATVCSPRAGETLGELAVAVKHGLRTRDLAGVVHPHPTDGPWNAAIADVRDHALGTPGPVPFCRP
jgi:hypothetical protein